ncbi:MAG: hypothetical protein ACLQSR_05795 [Limisphaerales bacterium]
MARCFLAAVLIFAPGALFADEAPTNDFGAAATAEFDRAQKLCESSDDSTNAIQFARACFDLANLATNNNERAMVARQGINACRRLLANEPKLATGHYYLGMNLGELARTEFLGALRIVREMEREFKAAAALDEQLDYAGPDRCLGLLYRDAPGWPASIGSSRKAKIYLEKAANLAPGYPGNILNLAESDLQWHEAAAAQKQLEALDKLWPTAQKDFAGDRWGYDWADWAARRDAVRAKLSARASPPEDGR